MTGRPPCGVLVGAYSCSPTAERWDRDVEEHYLGRLAALPEIGGLELPWTGRLHPAGEDDWLLRRLPDRWDVVLTTIVATMPALATDPRLGLASVDPEGRARAITLLARARDDVHRLADAAGRPRVLAVEVHSAPRGGSSAEALAESLREIAAWDWAGATVVVEHCDADGSGREAKGFLPVAREIRAVQDSGAPVAMSLNWGRSALELGDPDRVVEHVAAVGAAGLLDGLVLSGVAATDTTYGPAWADAHLPFAPDGGPGTAEGSLLDLDRAVAALAAGSPRWVAAKVGWRPSSAGVAERVEVVRATAARVRAACAGAARVRAD
jgi:hypothetical protein